MRLSDAIALGRTLIKAAEGAEWHQDGSGCARGMALEAIGCRKPISRYVNLDRFAEEWYWAFEVLVPRPCDCCGNDAVGPTVSHLFDHHVLGRSDWTLEQLIDWVRSVEPVETAPESSTALAATETPAEVRKK